ncbi:polyamine-transporting ATPase 13A3-like [Aethina tumida]|uniref:polyamine-transporting ATPase 13A3-like n=1 Tax=Aethina tumida TaxID=116153 RepID=UPI002148326D|nr:polyamine-transporting ATPase 13A3-like [Aethina tumida]
MRNYSRSSDYQLIDEIQFHQELFIDNQDDLKINLYGYQNHKLRTLLYHLFCITFLGVPYVIFESNPQLKAVKFKKCHLNTANVLLVEDPYGKYSIIKVDTDRLKVPNLGPYVLRYFFYQHTKFVWNQETEAFTSLDRFIPATKVDDYLNDTTGLFDIDYLDLTKLFGPNKIHIEIKSYWKLFVEEVFNAFYMFQVFSVALWCFDDYMFYAGCVVVLTLFSSIVSLIQTRRQSESLHELVEQSVCHQVKVVRQNLLCDSHELNLDPAELVPGDLIILPPNNFILPCDAVLLTGQCIVNESVLTGESVPVTKTALHSSEEEYSIVTHKRHTLFSGTTLLQTRNYGGDNVVARVVRTGFYTTKGALIKSILFPSPVNLQFQKDSYKFIFFLFVIASFGMSYCLYMYISRHAHLKDTITRALDIITIVVPPALPAAMAIGTVYSQDRLKKIGIFCTSPPKINVCGKIKLACFDKTGTLTHDSLDMNSVVPCENARLSEPVDHISYLDYKSKLVQAMACCHSLTQIDGELNGDPLELNMFEFTNWKFEEPGDDENARFNMFAPTVVSPGPQANSQNTDEFYQIGIIRQFPFSSTLQCMSVIIRNLEEPNMIAFTKGAPEKIMAICKKETLPNNYSMVLSNYTVQGYRVIAVAYKPLSEKFSFKQSQKVKRNVIECDLTFLGFLIMQNPLKSETKRVMNKLHNANIRTVMITGDNVLTAIAVARNCDMVKLDEQIYPLVTVENTNSNIPLLTLENNIGYNTCNLSIDLNNAHLAIDGKVWDILRQYYIDIIPQILTRTTIFARFQPDQKAQLIKAFQKMDYVVSMVGDGANDCGALKAAHIGVSLSQAEASVAAPFTSSINDISCLIHLMLEGRCALVTSFAIFKYMALYSLIQFITILILYHHRSILGDFQFLYIDLVITTALAVTIGRQGPSEILCSKRPIGSLISTKNTIPLILQIIGCALVQLGALYYLSLQEWFEPIPDKVHEEVIVSWENTVLFTVSCFQYIIIAIVYSKGKPYRKPLWTNFWFILSALLLSVFTGWIMIYPCKEVAKFMDIIYVHDNSRNQIAFKCILLGFPLAHIILAVLIENGIGDRHWFKKIIHCITRKTTPKNRYKMLIESRDFEGWLNFDHQEIRIRPTNDNISFL